MCLRAALTGSWLSRAAVSGGGGGGGGGATQNLTLTKLQWAPLGSAAPQDLLMLVSPAASAQPRSHAFYAHLSTAVPARIDVNEAVAWPVFAMVVVLVVLLVSVQYLVRLKLSRLLASRHRWL